MFVTATAPRGIILARYQTADEAMADAMRQAYPVLSHSSPPPEGYPVPTDAVEVDREEVATATVTVVVAKIDFYRRATDKETTDIATALGAQSPRIQAIFRAAVNFRSDAEEWPLLQAAAVGLFGEERAAVLLAPSAP